MKKKIAIIGAGYTGLGLAKELINNYEVDLIDSRKVLGGMTETFEVGNNRLEYFYRHIFKCDKKVVSLIKELGLESDLEWCKTKMGYYVKGSGSYLFGTPISLLKFKPLSLINKIRFGFGIIRVKMVKDYKKLENVTAHEWMIKHVGKKAYECIFEPLLISKFGETYQKVSMVWLWNKLVLRSSSGEKDGESLGYLKGSYARLTDVLENYLLEHGVNIITNSKVLKIIKTKNNKYMLETSNNNKKEYDIVISTVAFPIFNTMSKDLVDKKYLKNLESIKYTATKTLIIFMNKSFMPYYWLNIGDKNCPFGGLIEHTNMQDKSNYDNQHILYVSNYLYESNPLYRMNKKDLFKAYLPYLKEINPDFNEKWVKRLEVYEEKFAQPIIQKKYSKTIPTLKVPNENIYVASMPQIYPEDRGMNKALELANKVVELIGSDNER